MTDFVSFEEASGQSYGGKADSLYTLFQKNFPVPSGFIIPYNIINKIIVKDSKVKAEYDKYWILTNKSAFYELIDSAWTYSKNQLGDVPLAIRSSANMEDGSKNSFAGLFESVLNIRNYNEFEEAFFTCLLSQFGEKIKHYCQRNQLDSSELKLNLVIQQMIEADISGVIFTVNPMNGKDKELIIETVDGFGESLVQGASNPNFYRFDWYNEELIEKKINSHHPLNLMMLNKLANLALELQQHYGFPLDIEWCLKGEEIFILQARPLTSIHFDTKYDWTNADLKDGGIASEIASPFMFWLYQNAFEKTLSKYLKSVALNPKVEPDSWFTEFMLYSYWNISSTKEGLQNLMGYKERELNEDLGIAHNFTGDGFIAKNNLKTIFRSLKVLIKLSASVNKTIKKATVDLQQKDDLIQSYFHIKWSEISDNQLAENIDELVFKHHLFFEGDYFTVIYNNSNFTSLLKGDIRKYQRKESLNYLNLVAGIQNIAHLHPSIHLWNLSRQIRNHESALTYFRQQTANQLLETFFQDGLEHFQKELQLFIQKYAYHSDKELDLMVANWDENPRQVFFLLKTFIEKADSEDIIQKNKAQEHVFRQEFVLIKSASLRKKVLKHRQLLWTREEYRDRSSQMYHLIRKGLIEIGYRLVQRGDIQQIEDVFFLYPEQLLQAFSGDKKQL
ncbi:MAG: hypothetical protein JXR34_01995, partial [Bacteroidales bacterium]|nr:hypothetical protein [Bacteroidales bacterium]